MCRCTYICIYMYIFCLVCILLTQFINFCFSLCHNHANHCFFCLYWLYCIYGCLDWQINYSYSYSVDYIKGSEDRWQKVYKLLKERFPMKYTIISTILVLKPPLFMCKAKVSGHAVWGVSILPPIVATVYFFLSHYWHSWHFSKVHLRPLWCLK